MFSIANFNTNTIPKPRWAVAQCVAEQGGKHLKEGR